LNSRDDADEFLVLGGSESWDERVLDFNQSGLLCFLVSVLANR
jgi:hypothetical protein